MASVRLSGVGKRYGATWAVEGVDLSIDDGCYCVLVGPSGCGKSTTLRAIAGLEELDSGTIEIGGARVDHLPPHRRDVAFVFQGYALYPHLTVARNLSFGLERRRLHGSRLRALVDGGYRRGRAAEGAAIAARVREVAEQLELTPLLERRPRELSGGQQQRVALGRALVRSPSVYLLDEPLSNLDARLRVHTRAELRALQRRVGGTFVHVTHDQEEALALADLLVVVADGRVQQAGPPMDVHRAPANRFVAAFVGQPSANFVAGRAGPEGFEGAGLRVAARWRASGPAVLCLRPGDVELCPARGSGAAGRLGPARVRELFDHGDHLDVEVESRGGARLLVRTHRAALARAGLEPRAGDEVELACDPRRAHLFEPGEYGARVERL